MLYKVKATIKSETLKDFFTALTDGSVESQKPDGTTILKAMKEAVMLDGRHIAWYEACYCATPLRHERETVYDKYLTDFVCREGDAAEIKDENITLKGVAHALVLMVEMAKVS